MLSHFTYSNHGIKIDGRSENLMARRDRETQKTSPYRNEARFCLQGKNIKTPPDILLCFVTGPVFLLKREIYTPGTKLTYGQICYG